jgi:hypothetical protein
MTVSSVGARSAWDPNISFTSSGAELAALIVESEAEDANRIDQALEANKQRIARAAEEEYRANMEAADAASRAAWISGGFVVAGGLAGVGAGLSDGGANVTDNAGAVTGNTTAESLQGASGLLSRLAEPARELGGGIDRIRHEAEAKRIGRSIEQANVAGEQLAQQARRAEQRADSGLDHAQRLVEAEHARSTAILSNG